MIVRGPRHERNYVQVDNDVVRDARLSLKARGLLAYLLSQPPGHRVSSTDLAKIGPDRRDAIRSALIELDQAGYLERRRVRLPGGQFAWESTVFERPTMADQPAPENPAMVPPAQIDVFAGHTMDGFSVDGKPGVYRKTGGSSKTENASRPSAAEQQQIAAAFEVFWTSYPQRNGRRVGRKTTYDKWRQLNDTHRAEALEAVTAYAAAVARTETIPRDPERFLRSLYWQDWLGPGAGPAPSLYAVGAPSCPDCGDRGFILPDGASEVVACACRRAS